MNRLERRRELPIMALILLGLLSQGLGRPAAAAPAQPLILEQKIAQELLAAVKITPLIRIGKVVDEIVAAAKALKIEVHDHLVIGKGKHASFKALGLL